MSKYRETEWMERALCAQVDPELFFPDAGSYIKRAQAVCDACPVRAECLQYGTFDNPSVHGIYGGATDRPRRKLRKDAAA